MADRKLKRTMGMWMATALVVGTGTGTPGLVGTAKRCGRPMRHAWMTGSDGKRAHLTSRNSLLAGCRR